MWELSSERTEAVFIPLRETEKPELPKQEETVKPEAEKPKEEEKSEKKNPAGMITLVWFVIL